MYLPFQRRLFFFFSLARRFVVRLVPAASRAMDVLTLLKRDGYDGCYIKSTFNLFLYQELHGVIPVAPSVKYLPIGGKLLFLILFTEESVSQN